MPGRTLVQVRNVSKTFDDSPEPTLDRIDLDIPEGQFVALLGPSGSGKSTLLRIICGLIAPSEGQVLYAGQPVIGPNPKAAIVFQTFALYPWLTVQQNVELGLRGSGVPLPARAERAARLISLVGLDGFEDAYPKELSGGMRQRVGFARALAVEPELLCMDEPFSALDVLTAENLRDELLELWLDEKIPLKAVLMVTHGIEEAVYMADRIVVLSRNPARVIADLGVRLRHPRDRKSPEFTAFVDHVYKVLTGAPPAQPPEPARVRPGERARRIPPLPHAAVHMLAGLLELVEDRAGRDDLYHLAGELLMEVDDLLPVTEAAQMLGFATVQEADLVLTPLGKQFVDADEPVRKEIFYRQIRDLPIFELLGRVLRAKRNRTMSREFFLELLEEHFAEQEADLQLKTAIQWGRYAEMFHYDPASERLYIDEGDKAERDGVEVERAGATRADGGS